MTERRKVAIFIFDDMEVLDFAGPFEVFSASYNEHDEKLFDVYTVARSDRLVTAHHGLLVQPHYGMTTCPPPDILLVPGGRGTRPLLGDEAVIAWLQKQHKRVELLLSVCTGALVLAKTGLLDGLAATTYHSDFDELAQLAPNPTLKQNERWVDVSAGIDMSLHIVSRLHGPEQAARTAHHMEYEHWPHN